MHVLYPTHRDCLAQLADLLSLLDDDMFCQPLSLLSGSSIGQHTRHIIEFYECLNHALVQNIPVNYDARERKKQWETDRKSVLAQIPVYVRCFAQNDCKLRFCSTLNGQGTEPLLTDTSLFRELVMLIEHTTHHLAIMKMALRYHFPHLDLPDGLGVAYSTRQYRDSVQVLQAEGT